MHVPTSPCKPVSAACEEFFPSGNPHGKLMGGADTPAACRGRLMCRTGDLAGDLLSWSSPFWHAAVGQKRGARVSALVLRMALLHLTCCLF
jgi:hypothetical protein